MSAADGRCRGQRPREFKCPRLAAGKPHALADEGLHDFGDLLEVVIELARELNFALVRDARDLAGGVDLERVGSDDEVGQLHAVGRAVVSGLARDANLPLAPRLAGLGRGDQISDHGVERGAGGPLGVGDLQLPFAAAGKLQAGGLARIAEPGLQPREIAPQRDVAHAIDGDYLAHGDNGFLCLSGKGRAGHDRVLQLQASIFARPVRRAAKLHARLVDIQSIPPDVQTLDVDLCALDLDLVDRADGLGVEIGLPIQLPLARRTDPRLGRAAASARPVLAGAGRAASGIASSVRPRLREASR